MQAEPIALFTEAWKQMTDTLASPKNVDGDGISTRFADAQNLFFNLWFQNRPAADEADFRAILRAGKAAAASWHQPTGGIVRADWAPAGWEAILAEEGLAVAIPMLGMEAGEITPPSREPAILEIRRVADDRTAYDAAMINAHAYAMPEEQFACCGGMHFWPEGSLAFVGYIDGKPVATAAARPVNGTIYIAMVATEPDEQGKGYAATTMRHAMVEAREAMGDLPLTLHATQGGQATYAKMGFAAGPATPLVVPTA